MRLLLMSISVLLMLLIVPAAVSAQTDNFGVLDTVYADVARIDDLTWTVTVSYVNDQNVSAIALPLKFDAGEIRVVADSAVYWGGRVERFSYKGFRPDTAVQSVTMGLIASFGGTQQTLKPGKGRLVTVFVSSPDKTPFETLNVDTTTTSPNNTLMAVADRVQEGQNIDTIPMQNSRIRQIKPAWVVRQSQ